MRILFTADWHRDLDNLKYTVPAIEAGIEAAKARGTVDLFVHGGDLVVNRSTVHPHVAYTVRRLIEEATEDCALGAYVLAGNHDQSFIADRVGMVEGILGDSQERIRTISQAVTVLPIGQDDFAAVFVMVPTPNKYWAKAKAEEGADVSELLTTMISTMIAKARAHADQRGQPVIVVYHGTIGGAALSDEALMPSGVDITVPHEAFAGADLVLAGHIHHRQVISGSATRPPIYYSGAPAPLTWNDRKLEPGMWLIDVDGPAIKQVELVPLPVVSQMIHVDVDCEAGDLPNDKVRAAVAGVAEPGARVRAELRSPGAVIDGLAPDLGNMLAAELHLQACKVTSKRTDQAVARVEMSTTTSILDAVRRWSEMRGIDGDLLGNLMDLATDIEGRVSDKHLDARYEMRPLALTVENWCQYADAAIDFGAIGGLTVVEGANYSGKSNLSRAILFALYKQQVSGKRLEDLVRKGTDLMRVVFDFGGPGGQHYRIIREVKRGSKGATTSLHFLAVQDDGSVLPLAEGNARETQAAIDRLVGPLELFLATSFAGQNQVDSLLDLTPGDLKDLLMTILQRDFASRLLAGRENRDAHRVLSRSASDKADALRDSVAKRDDPSLVTTLTARLVERRDQATLATMAADTSALALAELKAKTAPMEQAVIASADAAAAVSGKMADRATAKRNADHRHHELDAVRAAAAAPVQPPKMSSVEAERIANDCAERWAATSADMRGALLEARTSSRAAAGDVALAAEYLRGYELALTSAMALLDQAGRDAALLASGKVPCGGAVLCRQESGETVDCGKCGFIERAVQARDDHPGLADAVVAASGAVETAVAALAVANITAEREAAAEAAASAKLDEAIADRERERAALDAEYRAAVNAEVAHAAYVAAASQVEGAQRAAAAADEMVDVLDREIALMVGAAAEHDDLAVVLRNHLIAVDAMDATSRRHAGAASLAAGELRTTESSLAAARARADDVARDRATVADLEGEAIAETALAQIADLYCEAVHRDGIPFILLEQFSIPLLQSVANDYLQGTNLSVQIESVRELQTGEARNAVEITFTDYRGRHHISMASGAQRTTIGSALRHGVAELLARGTGSQIYMAVQDEGFGTLDPENLEMVKRTLRNIADRRGTFIVISHVAGMSEVADHVLRVVDNCGVSHVEAA